MWDPTHRSKRRRRIALRRQLVHAAGCKTTYDFDLRCMIVERFNHDENWPQLARELGVRIPRSMRWIARWFDGQMVGVAA